MSSLQPLLSPVNLLGLTMIPEIDSSQSSGFDFDRPDISQPSNNLDGYSLPPHLHNLLSFDAFFPNSFSHLGPPTFSIVYQ
jgi:hypothetical protein